MRTLYRFHELSPAAQRWALKVSTWPYGSWWYEDGTEDGPIIERGREI